MARPKKNINRLLLASKTKGFERQQEILGMPLERSLCAPKPVNLKDMDIAFMEWAKSVRIVNEDGEAYPTIALYSNQRFSEYAQSWNYTDGNKNILLNFKAVTRDSNPQYGSIHKRLWNIPGERYHLAKRFLVLDDNGTESYLEIGVRQPMAVDLNYKLSLFTDKFRSLNEFNTTINKLFQARQCYLSPNGYYMPMVLDNIGDESEYSIDDRQFYSQTYSIKLMGYIYEEKDFSVTEVPLKTSISYGMTIKKETHAKVEIDPCKPDDEEKTIVITLSFPRGVKTVEFDMDEDFMIDSFEYDNLAKACKIYVNDDEVAAKKGTIFRTDDKVKVQVWHRNALKEGILTINGHNPLQI